MTSFVGASHKNTAGPALTLTSLTWTEVGTILAGDMAYAWLTQQTGSTLPSWTTLPAGFVPAVAADGTVCEAARTNCGGKLFVKRCVGGETGTMTFGNANSLYKSGGLIVLRGAGEIVAAVPNNNTSSPNIDGLTLTNRASIATCLYCTAQQASGTAATHTPPTNFTEASDESNTTNPSMAQEIAYRLARGPEASGALRTVSTVTANYADLTLYIADAAAQAQLLQAA